MIDDRDLLRGYAATHDEGCFRTFVERRIGFVYAVAFRRLGDVHAAQDATQAVFVTLARKAHIVAESPSILGWLHRSTCFESQNLRRTMNRRQSRERHAVTLGHAGGESPTPNLDADTLAVLDDALAELPERDRNAILARYFDAASYGSIGQATGLSENAARMRVERALERLRAGLMKRGVASTAALLASSLSSHATSTVPTAWPLMVSTQAIAQAAVATTTLAGPITLLTTMKASHITVAGALLAAASVAGIGAYRHSTLTDSVAAAHHEAQTAKAELSTLQRELNDLKAKLATAQNSARPLSSAPAGSQAAGKTEAPVDIPPAGVTRKAPSGWFKNGSAVADYHVGVDQNVTWGGLPSAYVESKASADGGGFGGMMQSVSAEAYRGERVRLNGWIRTEDVEKGAQLWLRIDGQTPSEQLGLDNMTDRAPQGTKDWQEYSLVLDVPPTASSMHYGFLVRGKGKAWVNAVTLTPVEKTVPTTNMSRRVEIPKAPVNLGFESK